MGNKLRLEVVTPQKSVLSEEISSLVVPAEGGYLGILNNHAPIITGLQAGALKYCREGKIYWLAIGGGFMEVSQNIVTILADSAERPEEIDLKRANDARFRAEQRLKDRHPGLDVARAEFSLRRSMARIKVAGTISNRKE